MIRSTHPIDGDTKQLMAAVADVGDAVAAVAMNAEISLERSCM